MSYGLVVVAAARVEPCFLTFPDERRPALAGFGARYHFGALARASHSTMRTAPFAALVAIAA
ncbi:MAG TPA: hypothetical protein VIU82_11135 [Bosea sp. (in: a-proteobacteria)]